jgi:hypothetical protein
MKVPQSRSNRLADSVADLAFGSLHKPRNVGAVHDPGEHGEKREQFPVALPKLHSNTGVAALAMSAASEE